MTVTATVPVPLRRGEVLIIDDSRDGTFAGMTPACRGCDSPVGYPDGAVPATDKEASRTTFIPCVQRDDEDGLSLYCIGCQRADVDRE